MAKKKKKLVIDKVANTTSVIDEVAVKETKTIETNKKKKAIADATYYITRDFTKVSGVTYMKGDIVVFSKEIITMLGDMVTTCNPKTICSARNKDCKTCK